MQNIEIFYNEIRRNKKVQEMKLIQKKIKEIEKKRKEMLAELEYLQYL